MRGQAVADDDAVRQRCVLGDWGTTRLRLFLMEHGTVVATREGPGIGEIAASSTATPIGVLGDLVAPWTSSRGQPLRVLLTGMAGSRDGVADVPYTSLPLRRETWFGGAVTLQTPSMSVSIAAGVQDPGNGKGPDVMRGEETQIFGAIELYDPLGRALQIVVLPGTHSKWVELREGSIHRFVTAMTGELFALLHTHSTLFPSRNAGASQANECDEAAGFETGVRRSATPNCAVLSAMFEARAAQLLEDKSLSWARGFVSGLLIGCEVTTLSSLFSVEAPICIIGDPKLAALYQDVIAARSMDSHTLDGDECAVAGLQSLRRHLAGP